MLSIIIPFKDKANLLEKCISSIENSNAGVPLEIILVNNNSKKKETQKLINNIIHNNSFEHVKLIEVEDPFNYSKAINYAVSQSIYENVILLNNDVFIITINWGSKVCDFLNKEKIGCVGIKLLNEDKSVQHLGIKLDFKNGAKEITKQSL